MGGVFCEELLEIFGCRIKILLLRTDRVVLELEHVFHSSSWSTWKTLGTVMRPFAAELILLDPYGHELVAVIERIRGNS